MSVRAEPVVSSFTWLGGRFLSALEMLRAENPGARLASTVGQFGVHHTTPSGEHILARDRLGVNKLFFAIDGRGSVESSNYWIELIRRGFPPDAIWSVPPGQLVTIRPSDRLLSLEQFGTLDFSEAAGSSASDDLARSAARIRTSLTNVFRAIREGIGDRRIYVSLSGGLDSTTIAVLTRELIGEFTAVTFSVGNGEHRTSEDYEYAAKVAAHLGVPFESVVLSPDAVLDLVDTVLLYGQDWRDFNVHCALVNAALGRAIHRLHAGSGSSLPPLLLTGDTMNELMADYSAVTYKGGEYYRLPRLAPGRLRRLLVSGLDAGDREIGVLTHFGVDALQPYALCADAYAALPDTFFDAPHAKQQLVRAVMGDRLPHVIYDRPKARAQAGSATDVGGTLAVLIDHGLDQRALESRFAGLFGLGRNRLGEFIRAGHYRSTATYPG